MRFLLAAAGVLFVTALATVVGGGQSRSTSAQPTLPPVSYVCPMEQDAAVLEDKPGKCPICGMVLVPVRLDSKWWCPTHQTNEVHDKPGKCPRDGKDLVQVTLSEFWTCASDPAERLIEPGTCADGKPRKIGYEVRAHGDHNPRHGGQFFMAENQWHHVEGTYPAPGTFRLFFYDNFTKPLDPKGFTGRLTTEINGRTETVALTRSRDGKTLQARLGQTPLPVKMKAWVKFNKDSREQPFDFAFDALSVDQKPGVATTTTARAVPAPPAQPAPPAPSASSSAQPAQPDPAPQEPGTFQTLVQVPPALAEAQDESRLPTGIPELLAELVARAKNVETLVHEGNLAQVWLPATGTKTVALVLDARASTLSERQRAAVTASVKRIVTAAWQLDAYGDLGNKDKIADAYQRLATAIADLQAAYAAR